MEDAGDAGDVEAALVHDRARTRAGAETVAIEVGDGILHAPVPFPGGGIEAVDRFLARSGEVAVVEAMKVDQLALGEEGAGVAFAGFQFPYLFWSSRRPLSEELGLQ